MKFKITCAIAITILVLSSCQSEKENRPNRSVVELNLGESAQVALVNGNLVNLTLVSISDRRDSVRSAIRDYEVEVLVDGEKAILNSGSYNLPHEVGKVQIDCPVISAYYSNSGGDRWGLKKDARFRLWPKGSPFIEPGSFVYPVKQRWFSNKTQFSNEPVYVNFGENPSADKIYYHEGLDVGGAEGRDIIVSATDGLVVSSRDVNLEGYEGEPVRPRYDVVYIVNPYGWYTRYSHFDSIFAEIQPGVNVTAGQPLGLMGKQGASGGWVHMHFGISTDESQSGEWISEDAYPYFWEAYVREHNPPILAVARPHQLLWAGEETVLDGSKSKGFKNSTLHFEWQLSDGTSVTAPQTSRRYDAPGEYSEILKVYDDHGNIDYDFTVAQVFDKLNPEKRIPTIQASFYPSFGIKPGQNVDFYVRTFNSQTGNETWDFGDGTSEKTTLSIIPEGVDPKHGEYAHITHAFPSPGTYIVSVKRGNENGFNATTHLKVKVEE